MKTRKARKKPYRAQQNITGVWDAQAGRYYIRQIGSTVWWSGVDRGPGNAFANVYRGTLNRRTGVISGRWADVPRGFTTGNGRLRLRVRSNRRLERISETGGFGDSAWNFVKPQGP